MDKTFEGHRGLDFTKAGLNRVDGRCNRPDIIVEKTNFNQCQFGFG